jgi:hypothetical protein
MLYSEIIAVCSEIHTKHINTRYGQNVEFVNVKHGGTYSNHWASKSPLHFQTERLHNADVPPSSAELKTEVSYSHHEDGGNQLFRNAGSRRPNYTRRMPQSRQSVFSRTFRPLISSGNPAKGAAEEPASNKQQPCVPAVEAAAE